MLKVSNISFAYQEQKILDNISFSIKKGEHLAIVGESGSGKTTLLKLLYGEYDLDQGEIYWNDQQILGPKFNLITGPDFMKHVAQEFDLMPYTSVEKNIGDFLSNLYPKKKKARINELLEIVELQDVAKTHVRYLSGGQKQRVALAKAIAKKPEILLLDEPFSHIDNLKRQSLRRNLFEFLKEENITCIVATHDKEDVISYADTMLVLHKGQSIAQGTPKQLYNNPKFNLIASFFGEFNEFKASEIVAKGKFGIVIVYPHEISIVEHSNLKATVQKSYYKGNYHLIKAKFNDRDIFIKSAKPFNKGTEISFSIAKEVIEKRTVKS